MTTDEMKALFEKHSNDEFLKFERVADPLSKRPDLHAFLRLDQIVPPEANWNGSFNDMVVAAEHDDIWIDTDVKKLAKAACEADIIELVRCGVRFNDADMGLCMFV